MGRDETIYGESVVGKRIGNLKKKEIYELTYNGKSMPLTTVISIGRARDNDLVISDSMASRYHAEIQKIRKVYYVKDLESTNGTSVNNEPVPPGKYIRLRSQDAIKIGRTEIILN